MSDISKIVAGTRVVDILHPKTRTPIGLKITLSSKDDDDVIAAEKQWREDQQTRAISGHSMPDVSLAEAKVLAALKAWEWVGDTTFEGKKPALTKDEARKVFKTLPWVYEQCVSGFVEYAAFFGD